MNSILNTI